MSANQNIIVLDCTKDLNSVKTPLIDCIAARIPYGEWYYGIDIEKKNKLVIFSGNSLSLSRLGIEYADKNRTGAETKPHLEALGDEWKDCIARPPVDLSVSLSLPLEDIIKSPVVEPVFFYFSHADPEWERSMERSDKVTKYTAEGYRGSTWGWATEGVHHKSLGDAEGRCFVVISGWESAKAHEAFRRTDEFKVARGQAHKGLIKAVEWFHVHVNKAK
ncbi:hypothetical protein PFICI_12006 [Pestalotiopsis fici W106-1]|uniref:Uncharacterized protein n=1 Tax=Pestalotiopsis fici (strain W106-1 / CGMCC3.15140) TaxID=1229662 RepID=W3WS17_PESFW|nr:uncharacterized protein PFICI_12006 [Pestalotiopsis fici W106-1]ETS76619.1 hypothetical protein PFICI_12006 [Pestalotiopsis fici W106-1]